MAKLLGVYKCGICGNMVEVLYEGAGEMVCCGEPMKLLDENVVDASLEKHIPVRDKEGSIFTVKVGSVSHPMTEDHYIEWIEVITGGKSYREFLKPGKEPQAIFCVESREPIVLRAYCNLHGLWKG